jgi:hypothetical protein
VRGRGHWSGDGIGRDAVLRKKALVDVTLHIATVQDCALYSDLLGDRLGFSSLRAWRKRAGLQKVAPRRLSMSAAQSSHINVAEPAVRAEPAVKP